MSRWTKGVVGFVALGVVGGAVAPLVWSARNVPEALTDPAAADADPSFQASLACRVKEACGPVAATLEVTATDVTNLEPVPPGYLDCAKKALLPDYAGAGPVNVRLCR